MKKVVIKEFDRTLLGIDLMLYCFFAVVGYIMLRFPELDSLKATEYISPIFYMFAFMSLVAYFVNRRPNDYEFLFFGLINIIVGTYVLVNELFPNSCLIVGSAVLIYSIANVLNKGYHTNKMINNNDINVFAKLAITILLTMLSLIVIVDLYNHEEGTSMVLGYYFMGFGLVSLLEPLLMILTRNPKIEKYLTSLSKNDKKVIKTKKRTTTIKEIKKKKPVKKD